ncbi:MAG TPA: sigma-70 region 4 domain-containing protein [Terracidiphilus sp.]|nr:sigma-70 region 4 domain-containing protein [Terracidiphilus sp.]
MSAALQLPVVYGEASLRHGWDEPERRNQEHSGARPKEEKTRAAEAPAASLAFYRKHTENMLRRYLYASIQVGRAPSILGDPVGRGWVSSRPVRTFEDAVIFVLDVERCLEKLSVLDRHLLSRIVLQEYTHAETAALMGMSVRAVGYKFPQALDRCTETLLESGLLVLPHG